MSDKIRSLKIHSQDVTEGFRRAPSRAMLRAVGMTDDDFDKPQVGVASTWNEVTPCNLPLARLAQARQGRGARSRRVPLRVRRHLRLRRHLDGPRGHARLAREPGDHRRLGRGGHARRALRRLRRPRRVRQVAARRCSWQPAGSTSRWSSSTAARSCRGTSGTGRWTSCRCSRRSAHAPAGTIDDAELTAIERNACPTEGSCAGMFTANTMASVAEALGMALPAGAAAPAVDRRRDDLAYASGRGGDRPCSNRASGRARS